MSSASSNNPVALELARRIVDFNVDIIPEQAIESSKVAILDTIGITLGAVQEPSIRHLISAIEVGSAPGALSDTQLPSSAGLACVFGTRLRAGILDAAMINATGSHALDYDDFSQPMGGHQSAPLVGALFALAETQKISGIDLLHAYVVGIETEIRVARAVNFHHYDKGWHPTATIGIFGTVAACGYLLKLTEAQLATALAISTSLASGLKGNFGTMVKPLHVGACARNGLLAVLLARSGYDASLDAFEHKQGFFNVYNGSGNYDATKIFENWANPLEVLSDQMGLKQFPCCGSSLPAVTMMLKLRQQETFSLDDVRAIEVLLHKRRLTHTDNPNPTSELAAKFSTQYNVCRVLVSQALRIADFVGDAIYEPDVRRMMALTTTRPHPDMPDDSPNQFGAEVRVTLKNGVTLSRKIDNLVGRGISYPMTIDELWEKYSDCAQICLTPEKIHQSFDALLRLEQIQDIRELTDLLMARD